MPRTKTTLPIPTKEKGQRSLEPDFLWRWLPQWTQPDWLTAQMWRRVVAYQPVATICRETLIANLVNLQWKIDARESDNRDELKDEIKYYEKFFEQPGDLDWVGLLEIVVGDYLDLPFGGAVEVGHAGDTREGRVLWIAPLDGGTLFPTLSSDWPVGQALTEYGVTNFQTVYFPPHGINRLYMSPRSYIMRKGWGMAPPEKIYLSLELLNRGDRYYANLLLDTPEIGILDLGDIEESSAKEWVKSWRELLTGIDPFKIPVLYGHDRPATWIGFTRSPTELMFDKATMKYISVCTAGYGMGLSDIGIQTVSSGGDTLAGSIRQERKTRNTGFGRAKRSLEMWMNRMIHPDLKFTFIDLDDEVSVALGRARLATATALGLAIDKGALIPEEMRMQMIADGLISISIPEIVPESEVQKKKEEKQQEMFDQKNAQDKTSERPGLLGRPIAPSQGGWGEKRSLDAALKHDPEFKSVFEELENTWDTLPEDVRSEAVAEIQKFLSGINVPEIDGKIEQKI